MRLPRMTRTARKFPCSVRPPAAYSAFMTVPSALKAKAPGRATSPVTKIWFTRTRATDTWNCVVAPAPRFTPE